MTYDHRTMLRLSPRERVLMKAAAEGQSDQQIAQAMGISVATVRGYWLRARHKVGGINRSEMVGRWVKFQCDIEAETLREAHLLEKASLKAEFKSVIFEERNATDGLLPRLPHTTVDKITEIRLQTDDRIDNYEVDMLVPTQ